MGNAAHRAHKHMGKAEQFGSQHARLPHYHVVFFYFSSLSRLCTSSWSVIAFVAHDVETDRTILL